MLAPMSVIYNIRDFLKTPIIHFLSRISPRAICVLVYSRMHHRPIASSSAETHVRISVSEARKYIYVWPVRAEQRRASVNGRANNADETAASARSPLYFRAGSRAD